METTFEAVAAFVVAVLPGALYTWSVEREDGPWAVGFADRLYRFVGASAVFGAVFAWPLYAAYGRFVVTGDLRAGRPLPWWTWFAVLGYVGVPVVTGAMVGLGRRRGWAWVRPLTGPENVPRGWDQLFHTHDLGGVVRLTLLDGTVLAGVWSPSSDLNHLPGSHAASYPYEQDLYFVDTLALDADGTPRVGDDGRAVQTGAAALVRWEQVAYAEFLES